MTSLPTALVPRSHKPQKRIHTAAEEPTGQEAEPILKHHLLDMKMLLGGPDQGQSGFPQLLKKPLWKRYGNHYLTMVAQLHALANSFAVLPITLSSIASPETVS